MVAAEPPTVGLAEVGVVALRRLATRLTTRAVTVVPPTSTLMAAGPLLQRAPLAPQVSSCPIQAGKAALAARQKALAPDLLAAQVDRGVVAAVAEGLAPQRAVRVVRVATGK